MAFDSEVTDALPIKRGFVVLKDTVEFSSPSLVGALDALRVRAGCHTEGEEDHRVSEQMLSDAQGGRDTLSSYDTTTGVRSKLETNDNPEVGLLCGAVCVTCVRACVRACVLRACAVRAGGGGRVSVLL